MRPKACSKGVECQNETILRVWEGKFKGRARGDVQDQRRLRLISAVYIEIALTMAISSGFLIQTLCLIGQSGG